MGFTPQQVNDMSLWQFMTAVDGFAKFQGGEGSSGLSAAEKDDLWEWIDG